MFTMSLYDDIVISKNALEIIDRSSLANEEKILVAQILNNYYTRGLLWQMDSDDYTNISDETIAVTELIVLVNCLKKMYQTTVEKEGSLK